MLVELLQLRLLNSLSLWSLEAIVTVTVPRWGTPLTQYLMWMSTNDTIPHQRAWTGLILCNIEESGHIRTGLSIGFEMFERPGEKPKVDFSCGLVT